MFNIGDINNISCNKISELFIEKDEKILKVLKKKRERTKNCTTDENNSFEIGFAPNEEFKFFGNNIEINNNLNNIKKEYIYVGCEDGNIKMVKLNNESIFNIFFN